MVNEFNGKTVLQEAPVPTLKDIVSVLLNPKPDEAEKAAQYTDKLRSLLGNHKIGRMDIVLILAASMEPCKAAISMLGELFPNLIPLRTTAEAWKLVTDNPGFLVTFEKRCGQQVLREERKSVMTLRMFEAALFWNPQEGIFLTYLLDSRPKRSEIARSKDQSSGVDADGLFYSESRQTADGERATGISARQIADPNVVDRLMAGSEAMEGNEEVRKWLNKRLVTLDERAEKVLRMRFGVTIPENAKLPSKANWDTHPTTAARVQLEELRILDRFRKNGLETDVRNSAARNADAARKRRLASG
ncbi:MAG: hypothetical protein AABW86_04945 [Candidatus Micrarchaeota archaeon]